MSSETKRKLEAKNRTIYIIKNPMSREFIIDYTLTQNLRSAYKDHYNGIKNKTRAMVNDLRKNELKPCCFVLETLDCIPSEAYRHAIILTKFFIDQGFENIDSHCDFVKRLSDDNEKLYNSITTQNPSEIINCQNCKYPSYGRSLCPLCKCLDESKTPKIG